MTREGNSIRKSQLMFATMALVALTVVLFQAPIAIAAVLYSSDGRGTISTYPSPGVRSIFANNLKEPQEISLDQSGNIYVAEPGTGLVLKIAPTGSQSTFAQVQSPEGVAIDAAGNV